MRIKDFTPDIAKKVMELWSQHLGVCCESQRYLEHPELLAWEMQSPNSWITGRFEDRIGSKWTDDSKLLAYLRTESGLEFECYVQAHTIMGQEIRQEAEKAEDEFKRNPTPPVTDWRIARSLRSLGRISKNTNILAV